MARGEQSFENRGPGCCTPRSLRLVGMILVGAGLLVGGVFWLNHSAQNGNAQPLNDDNNPPPSPLFRNWGKPTVAIVLSGQMYGYLLPCGCSKPQYGGLERRYNFVQSLKDKGWPLVALDLGDLAARGGPQDMLKFETSLRALDLMNYTAVGLGKNEFYLPLLNVLGFKVNFKPADPPYLVSANLQNNLNLAKSWVVADKGSPAVGVASLIAPSVMEELKKFPAIQFAPQKNGAILSNVLGQLGNQKTELVVLLYQGTEKEARACAEFCADIRQKNPQLPRVDVILCLEKEEEPSGVPTRVGDSMIVGVGHKSRYVGVVGAFPAKGGPGFDLKYQLVSLGPDLETPKGMENTNPVIALMEKYAAEVKNRDFLSQFPRNKHPIQLAFPGAFYVGSDRCKKCHEHAYTVWKGSPHSHAFADLANAKHPSLRQFDGECVVCHTVGFKFHTGYADKKTVGNLLLENVGCESCHGPGSAHIKNTNNMQIRALMNPLKTKPGESQAAQRLRVNRLDGFCEKCHDIDNDVHWGKRSVSEWSRIAHPSPPAAEAVEGRDADQP